jgi:hypothetical protein
MEQAVLQQIKDYVKRTSYKKVDAPENYNEGELEQILTSFNQCRANEGSDEKITDGDNDRVSKDASCSSTDKPGELGPKIAILSNALQKWGFKETLTWYPDKKGGTDGYNIELAKTNRETNFNGLDPSKYPSANLPKGAK